VEVLRPVLPIGRCRPPDGMKRTTSRTPRGRFGAGGSRSRAVSTTSAI